MSITCSWDKPLGKCYSKYDEKRTHQLTIYGGGNCTAVICNKDKDLIAFIIDEKHFKACKYQGDEFKDIVISYARKREALKLIKLLASAGFEFTTTKEEF